MTLLEVAELRAGYGPVNVLHGVDFNVSEGEVVVILGANGSGKTTTLRAVSGIISCRGAIRFEDRSILGNRPEKIAQLGIAHVPQGRGTLTDLTVEENLRLGAYSRRDDRVTRDVNYWYDVFPRLGNRRGQAAGSMSGGEQQMLAIARAMMSVPKLLLLDEPSLGLAPIITQELFRVLADLNTSTGLSMLIVEQNAGLALGIATRGYVLESGAIAVRGSAEELAADDDVRKAYLGI
ncbi:MAG: ABC transporter ATP-binding protein [Actinomycetota bacterium]|nr:ABC transporter ATP-binding protein [Actinomycetota bacterium]